MNKKLIAIIFLITLTIASCNSENEDEVAQPNKEGSVEITIGVEHLQDKELITTKKYYWVKNTCVLTKIEADTVPSLGTTTDTYEADNGDDSTIIVPKNYEFYITVK